MRIVLLAMSQNHSFWRFSNTVSSLNGDKKKGKRSLLSSINHSNSIPHSTFFSGGLPKNFIFQLVTATWSLFCPNLCMSKMYAAKLFFSFNIWPFFLIYSGQAIFYYKVGSVISAKKVLSPISGHSIRFTATAVNAKYRPHHCSRHGTPFGLISLGTWSSSMEFSEERRKPSFCLSSTIRRHPSLSPELPKIWQAFKFFPGQSVLVHLIPLKKIEKRFCRKEAHRVFSPLESRLNEADAVSFEVNWVRSLLRAVLVEPKIPWPLIWKHDYEKDDARKS